MILAAHQPQYLAYTGYFDKLDQADVFILLDTVQYKKNEWINRNRIKTPNGPLFVTVPVSFNFGDAIKDVSVALEVDAEKVEPVGDGSEAVAAVGGVDRFGAVGRRMCREGETSRAEESDEDEP